MGASDKSTRKPKSTPTPSLRKRTAETANTTNSPVALPAHLPFFEGDADELDAIIALAGARTASIQSSLRSTSGQSQGPPSSMHEYHEAVKQYERRVVEKEDKLRRAHRLETDNLTRHKTDLWNARKRLRADYDRAQAKLNKEVEEHNRRFQEKELRLNRLIAKCDELNKVHALVKVTRPTQTAQPDQAQMATAVTQTLVAFESPLSTKATQAPEDRVPRTIGNGVRFFLGAPAGPNA